MKNKNNQIKFLLSSAPVVDPTMPSSATASLFSYLKENKYNNVFIADWNIEYIDWILNSKRLLSYYKKMLSWMKERAKKEVSKDDANKFRTWYGLFNEKQFRDQIAFIDKAKQIVKSKNFYNVKKYEKANKCIGFIFRFFESISFPFIITPFVYYNYGQKLNTQSKMSTAVQDYFNLELKPLADFAKDVVLKKINRIKPDCVGLSLACSSQIFPACILAKAIKDNSNCRIVFGGAAISQMVENIVDGHVKVEPGSLLPYVDDIIYGDAEVPLIEYLNALSKQNSLTNELPNLVQANGVFNPNTKNTWQAGDLSSFPTPDYTKHPLNLYLTPKPILSVPATRGCYWSKCVFCRESYRGFGNTEASAKYRERDIKLVVEDFKKIKSKHKTDCFMLSVCSATSKYLLNLSDELIKQKVKIKYVLDLRIDKDYLNKRNTDKLYKGGMRIAAIGFESACNEILSTMKKGTTASQISKCFKILSKSGIIIKPLWFAGFPDETEKQLNITVDFLIKHKNYVDDGKDIYPLVMPIGSLIYRNAKDFNLEIVHDYGVYDPLASYNYVSDEMKKSNIYRRNAIEKMSKHFPSLAGYLLFSNFVAHSLVFIAFDGTKTIGRFEKTLFDNSKKDALKANDILKMKKGFLRLKEHTFLSKVSIKNDGSKVNEIMMFSETNMHSAVNADGARFIQWFKNKRSIAQTKAHFKRNEVDLAFLDRLLSGNFIEYIY